MDAYLRVIYTYKRQKLGKGRTSRPLEARKITDPTLFCPFAEILAQLQHPTHCRVQRL